MRGGPFQAQLVERRGRTQVAALVELRGLVYLAVVGDDVRVDVGGDCERPPPDPAEFSRRDVAAPELSRAMSPRASGRGPGYSRAAYSLIPASGTQPL